MSLLEFLHDLTNPTLDFLPRALIGAILAAVLCAVVGIHVTLRGLGFVGDALSHAIFPGIAIAFAAGTSLYAGGMVAGVIVAVLIALSSQNRRVREDSLIGIFFAAAFALGLVIIARVPGYTGSLESFLFGSLTGIGQKDILTSFVGLFAILLVLALAHRSLVAVSVDREFARSQGVKVYAVDLLLYILIAVTVVMSVQSVGNILVLSLLLTPGATTRLLTDSLRLMLVLAPLIGAVSAFFGIYLSWSLGVPTGGAIVLVASAIFSLAWLVGPKGFLAHLRGRN